jgi:hypothetical protein
MLRNKNQENQASSSLNKLCFRSRDAEFEHYQHALEPKKDRISAASANDTRDVIGLPLEEKLTDESYRNNKKVGNIRKYTIKQGHTKGNTIAEFAAQLRLSRVREKDAKQNVNVKEIKEEKYHGIAEDEKETKELKQHDRPIKKAKDNPRYAKSFLVTELKSPDQTYSTAEDFIEHLYAASRWQPDLAHAVNACKLFGFVKRPKPGAGTFHPELFEDLRKLNEECELGLEEVFHATALTADLDFHTDNYLLNFDLSQLEEDQKTQAEQLIEQFKALFKDERPIHNRANHLREMIAIINEIKNKGRENHKAHIYFHKIDHDSGLYRFCDEEREVSLRDHGTAIAHIDFIGVRPHIRMQPTNHLAELLVGERPEDFITSNASMDAVMANPINQQVLDSQQAMNDFFAAIHQQCQISVQKESEQLRAELILLKHFQQHITSGANLPVEVMQHSERELRKKIEYTRKDIQTRIEEATIQRGISLHTEYLDFISGISQEQQNGEVKGFKDFLQKDKEAGIYAKITLHKASIEVAYKQKRWFSFMSDAESAESKAILEKIMSESEESKLTFQRRVIHYLSAEKNTNHRLYKIISQQIGEKSMPLYQKSRVKQLREGLAGIRKNIFWLGVGLIGAVLLGAAAIGLAVLTGGIAVPVLLPALGSIIGGVGVGFTTIAAATNPATQRWYRNTTFLKKVGFCVGVSIFLAAATVLTGGAALALIGAVSVVAGVAMLLGLKAAVAVSTTAAITVKAATITAGAVEGAGLAAQAIKSASTKKIVRKLDGARKKVYSTKSDDLKSPLLSPLMSSETSSSSSPQASLPSVSPPSPSPSPPSSSPSPVDQSLSPAEPSASPELLSSSPTSLRVRT